MGLTHDYTLTVRWTGQNEAGTTSYRSYSRAHDILSEGKPRIQASADPAFMGDPALHHPEELFVASLSECHMLWYLHLCADEGVVVTDYVDQPRGTLKLASGHGGRFTRIELRPVITITSESSVDTARALHDRAHQYCFIAQSVNVDIVISPEFVHGVE
ncbi:OsmC family protein [Larsenimonas rhizosphaerae]|uniref:OsmC family protein n=1 Tax=Larsenimonas rhizosphaerae TaxID=2944682 RepID=UPI00203433FB|nr:OsmC family protein [Larsenimonas rhizosphaerae]MCM2130169.1 OsmC family protein [Larsenimonas rhizosphaerae]